MFIRWCAPTFTGDGDLRQRTAVDAGGQRIQVRARTSPPTASGDVFTSSTDAPGGVASGSASLYRRRVQRARFAGPLGPRIARRRRTGFRSVWVQRLLLGHGRTTRWGAAGSLRWPTAVWPRARLVHIQMIRAPRAASRSYLLLVFAVPRASAALPAARATPERRYLIRRDLPLGVRENGCCVHLAHREKL